MEWKVGLVVVGEIKADGDAALIYEGACWVGEGISRQWKPWAVRVARAHKLGVSVLAGYYEQGRWR